MQAASLCRRTPEPGLRPPLPRGPAQSHPLPSGPLRGRGLRDARLPPWEFLLLPGCAGPDLLHRKTIGTCNPLKMIDPKVKELFVP